jgi:hypothetical protein
MTRPGELVLVNGSAAHAAVTRMFRPRRVAQGWIENVLQGAAAIEGALRWHIQMSANAPRGRGQL